MNTIREVETPKKNENAGQLVPKLKDVDAIINWYPHGLKRDRGETISAEEYPSVLVEIANIDIERLRHIYTELVHPELMSGGIKSRLLAETLLRLISNANTYLGQADEMINGVHK